MSKPDAIFAHAVKRGAVGSVSPSTRILCFPWSGGGTSYYLRWAPLLPDDVEVVAVRLKGRESRYSEDVYQNKEEIVTDIVDAILRHKWLSTCRVAFFGHSLGSILATETALRLKQKHQVEPHHIFVSGASAPNSPQFREYLKTRNYSSWTDEDLKKWLIGHGGTPATVLEDPEFFKIHAKAMRADLNIVENYKFEHDLESCKLSCPITCFDGDKDVPHDQDSFALLTSSREFSRVILPGGHFYLYDESNRDVILRNICDSLSGW